MESKNTNTLNTSYTGQSIFKNKSELQFDPENKYKTVAMQGIMSKDEQTFFELRNKIMLQSFFKLEYAKRHFIINNNTSFYKGIIQCYMLSNLEDNQFVDEISDALVKYIRSPEPKLNSFSDFIEPLQVNMLNIAKCEYLARKIYKTHFEKLFTVSNMLLVVSHVINKQFSPALSIEADNYNNHLNADRIKFINSINWYPNYWEDNCLLEIQKENIKNFDITSESFDLEKKVLEIVLVKMENGCKLSDYEFKIINEEMKKYYNPKIKDEGIESRAIGLLYYDLKLAEKYNGTEIKNDYLLNLLNYFINKKYGRLSRKKEEPYIYKSSKHVKRKFRDSLNLASKCINLNQVLTYKEENTTELPNDFIFPEYDPYYQLINDYISSLTNLESCNALFKMLSEDRSLD